MIQLSPANRRAAFQSATLSPIGAVFMDYLAGSPHTKAKLADAELQPGLHTFPAGTQNIGPCIGPGWVAVGDAACAFDPLSSLGIGHAIASGIQGAQIVNERLQACEDLARAFPGDVKRDLNTFLAQQQKVYATERRWPGMHFWARRQRFSSKNLS